jgi:YegS/Rv2252/BmrU family lipid kinase
MKPSDGYIVYIINPKSGASSSKLLVWRFIEYLKEKSFDVRVRHTNSLEHARELATDAAVHYDCRLVVAAGGDGTVREVAQGLEGSDKLMLPVPCGTENLLANEMGFDERLRTIIETFEAGVVRSLDLGSANGRCFTSIVGVGFDGQVVQRVSRQRRGHIVYLDYFWPIWRTFWEYRFPAVRIWVDDKEIYDGSGLVFVGNISRYAIGLQICRYADFSDGLLDVCVYKCASMAKLIKHSLMTAVKQHAGCRSVIYRQGKSVRITSSRPNVQTEIDGDPGPALPVDIEVIPQAVNVLVPQNARPAGIRTHLVRMLG